MKFHPFKSVDESEFEVGDIKFQTRNATSKSTLKGMAVFCKFYLTEHEFEHDLAIARQLYDHEAFVRTLAVCEKKVEFRTIIMEMAEEDLFGALHESEIRCYNIRNLQFQIVSAVEFMHQRGLIHRDLKTDNILLFNNRTRIKICDYGSVASEDRKLTSNIHFSDSYVPPEFLLDATSVMASDIWSLGCIFFQMRCGKAVFNVKQKLADVEYLFGTPSEIKWPDFHRVIKQPRSSNCCSPQLVSISFAICGLNIREGELLSRMFRMFPGDRITAKQILKHDYFSQDEKEDGKLDCQGLNKFWEYNKFVMDPDYDKRNSQVVFAFTDDPVLMKFRSQYFGKAHS